MVVVDVDDPRLRRHALGDPVGIARRRQAGPDVQELPDARPGGEVMHGRGEERAAGPGDHPHDRHDLENILSCRPVGGEARVNDDESLEVAWFPLSALPELRERTLILIDRATSGAPGADFTFSGPVLSA